MIELVLIDTNIFIEIFRNRDKMLQALIDNFDEACLNTIVYLELIGGGRDRKHYAATEKYLSQYRLIHLTPAICQTSIELMRRFKLSHGLDFPDALIAATCLEHDLFLFYEKPKTF